MRIKFDKRALRRLRTAKGLDVTTLAARAGCTKQNVSLIDRGLVEPKVSTLAKLAQSLEAVPEQFFLVEL